MLIKQLSIFLENKKGRFTEVAKILGEAGVNMSAFTVAENSDFGILRLIVSDTEKAISVLIRCKRGRRGMLALSQPAGSLGKGDGYHYLGRDLH